MSIHDALFPSNRLFLAVVDLEAVGTVGFPTVVAKAFAVAFPLGIRQDPGHADEAGGPRLRAIFPVLGLIVALPMPLGLEMLKIAFPPSTWTLT